jgi:hypothetical protein
MCEPALAPRLARADTRSVQKQAAMRVSAWLAVLSSVGVAAGCSTPTSGGQTGGEGFGCRVDSTETLALEQDSPLGFSAATVVAVVGDPRQPVLTWERGGTSPLTLEVQYQGGAVRYEERTFFSDDGSEIAMDCPSQIVVDAQLGFTTEDGAFAESWTVPVRASVADAAEIRVQMDDLTALAGAYQVTEVDPADFDAIGLALTVAIDATAAHGEVSGIGVQEDHSGDPDGAASFRVFPVAAF